MNKKIALLFSAAVMTLPGCSLFGNKGKQALQDLADENAVKTPVEGHEIATDVKNNQEYYLGVYRRNENIVRFANGDYHRDNKGFYPFYLGTTTNISEACTVKVKMLNPLKKTFGLLVSAPNQAWDGKYIGVYGSSSAYGNNVTSIALLDDPKQTTFTTIVNHQQTTAQNVPCAGIFKFYDYYDELAACAPGVMFKNDVLEEEEAAPKFFGTGHNANVSKGEPDYTSIDAKDVYNALGSVETYDLMHLYIK